MRTFGSIRRDGLEWVVTCEPHVQSRLKRVFGKVARSHRKGSIALAMTPENTYELNWFAQRYPMSLDGDVQWEDLINRFVEKRTAIETILDTDYQPALFDSLALPARHYQRVAADLALKSRGLLLADDLGIGKTISALAMLTDPRTRPALVVTMTHLPRQWQRELARFMPGLAVHVLKSGQPYDLCKGWRGRRAPFPDVIISNYHKLAGWQNALAGKVKSVTFDECQELRHNGTYKYDSAKAIADAADFRLGLSATPIYNYGGEIFNVFECLSPGSLGSRGEFGNEWCGGGGGTKAIIEKPEAMGTYLREQGLLLRRTRKDVGRELPDLVKVTQYVDSDLRELDKIGATVAELCKVILARDAKHFDRLEAGTELDWRLRQATGLAKAPFVADFVKLLVENGEQVVLYGWHHAVYDVWRDKLRDVGVAMYTGQESINQKEESKKAFLSGKAKVLVMSLRSGAGLDGLQEKGRTVVFGELDWSPGVHEQATGRIHRDGQRHQVLAYYMLSDEGSDPVIADTLGLKESQIVGVRDGVAPLFEKQGDTGADRIRKLAEQWLAKRGLDDDEDGGEAERKAG